MQIDAHPLQTNFSELKKEKNDDVVVYKAKFVLLSLSFANLKMSFQL